MLEFDRLADRVAETGLPNAHHTAKRIKRFGHQLYRDRDIPYQLDTLKIAGLELNIKNCQVQNNGSSFDLTETETKLLHFLGKHLGRTLPKADIMQEVWGYSDTSTELNLRQYIRDLRKKLKGNEVDYLQIFTVPRTGYKMIERNGDVPTAPPEIIHANGLTLYIEKRRANLQGKDIDLTPREFSVIATLVRNHNDVVTTEELVRSVWDEYDAESWTTMLPSLRHHVLSLRKKIESPNSQLRIQTHRFLGYSLI